MDVLTAFFLFFLALIPILQQDHPRLGRAIVLAALLAILGFGLSSRVSAQEVKRSRGHALYQQLCQRCHESDGKGGENKDMPNFTRRAWHDQKSDTQLVVSILEGRGSHMPAFRTKLDDARAKELVAFIRAFSPASPEKPAEARTTSEFDKELRQLQDELQELKRQFKALNTTSMPSTSPMALASRTGGRQDAAEPQKADRASLYRDHCQRCHGKDGSGVAGKLDATNPPDFKSQKWHAERGDAQLVAVIRNGKGTGMPAFVKRLSEEEIQRLAEYIRSLKAPRGATSSGTSDPSPW